MMFMLQPEKWIERYTDYLSNYARKKVPIDLVQDLLQDTFYSGLKSAKNYKGSSNERTWLTSILKYKIIDYYRKMNTKKSFVNGKVITETNYNEIHTTDLEDLKLSNSSIEEDYFSHELELIIHNGINILSKLEQKTLRLRIQGYSTLEICNLLNIKKGHCWVLINKARKKMQVYLENNWENVI